MKFATYENSSEAADGDGVCESTVMTRIRRDATRWRSPTSPGRSNTSRRHSR
jgi:hypothetical protein